MCLVLGPRTLTRSKQNTRNIYHKRMIKGVLWFLIQRSPHRFSLSEKMQLIDRCFARGSVGEILDALDDSGDAWAAKQAANMRKMSPTSMEVTFK